METKYLYRIAEQNGLTTKQVNSVYQLHTEGSTIPFIARYRKEATGNLDEVVIGNVVEEIAYFFSDGRLNFFKTFDNRKFVLDYTMDDLEEMLDPEKYFRISRSFYISVESVDQIHEYFGNRLLLHLKPTVDKEAVVSREKVSDFKKWMGK